MKKSGFARAVPAAVLLLAFAATPGGGCLEEDCDGIDDDCDGVVDEGC